MKSKKLKMIKIKSKRNMSIVKIKLFIITCNFQ